MNHLVLARKYRPRFFCDVVGQDVIVNTLKKALETSRVAHAMLFTGGRGIGKTTIARIVAKALVCVSKTEVEPCGLCAQCESIDNFSSLDVVEIDGASHTGVDDIRDLRDSARYLPTSAKYKIFIIDEVHMLSVSAFNALLKILEEPPPHVMFIFATTEAHKIPKTILSRCQRYDFKRMSNLIISDMLKKIVDVEGFSVDDDGLLLIASLADGGMRDALSMLELILSHEEKHHSAESIAEVLGIVSHRAVKDICQALMSGNPTAALLVVKEVYDKGLDLCQLMDAIAERLRVMSLCAHIEQKNVRAIIPSVDEQDFLLANQYDKADLKRLFAMAIDGITQVFHSPKPLLALELFVLRAALRPPISDAMTINYCLQKLDAIMHNRPLPKAELPLAESKDLVKDRTPLPAKDVSSQFRSLLATLQKSLPLLASHLRFARPTIDGNQSVLSLFFDQSLHYEQALRFQNNQTFMDALAEVFGLKFVVRIELKKSVDSRLKEIKTVAEAEVLQQKQEQDSLYQKAKENPLVKKALEIFGGDITEVKKIDNKLIN
jgi:DNA polymerase-3 subunit gamma/tau